MTKEICIRMYADPVHIRECRKKISRNEKIFSQISKLFSLAGNEVRLKILFLLKEEEKLCPCDIADILGMTVPAISQHLRKMKDGNIIKSERKGQTIFYSLRSDHLKILSPLFNRITQSIKQEVV